MLRIKKQQDKKIKILIKRDRKLINAGLKAYLKKFKGVSVIDNALRYAVLSGGKRFRSILMLESSRALAGDIKKTLPFACAIELVHNFSLVHDDLPALDNDDFRRGKPSCHKKFGEAVAILAGDELLNLAFGIIAESGHPRTPEIISLFTRSIGGKNMIGGQALELVYRKNKLSPRLKGKIDRMKTASLMELSCEAGALVASAKPKDIKKMREFGTNLGRAFQIKDDLEDGKFDKPTLARMKKYGEAFILKGEKCITPFKEKAQGLEYLLDIVLSKINEI